MTVAISQQIELVLSAEIVRHIGASRIRFDWKPNPPDDGCMIRDAVLVYSGGSEEPLSNYGCYIRVADYSDPVAHKVEPPCEWIFELAHDFLNADQGFQEWRIYKRDESPLVVIEPWDA